MWIDRPGRWRGRAFLVRLVGMRWSVGVLRRGSENITWTAEGEEPDWSSARRTALDALLTLAQGGGRSEYHVHVGDVEAISRPGIGADGRLDLSIIDDLLPAAR